jgi:uncharacterized membrane protein YhaH (DUF805 family)
MITGMVTAGGVGVVLALIYLVALIVALVASAKVLTKAGYSGWWVLMVFVPIVNFVMFLVFAFSDWPALRNRATPVDPSWPSPPR